MKWRIWAEKGYDLNLVLEAPDAASAAQRYAKEYHVRVGARVSVTPVDDGVRVFVVGVQEVVSS